MKIFAPLSATINQLLAMGHGPKERKQAKVLPNIKKGSKTLASNYRPISLTSQIYMIFESIMCEQMIEHLNRNPLTNNTQCGPVASHGHPIFLDRVTQSVNECQNIVVVCMDFEKNFDKVPHRRLMQKIRAYDIDGSVAWWIHSWLKILCGNHN